MPIIEVENFTKQYPLPDSKNETFFAVDGVSLHIDKGEIFGILGPNGAGKTTTLEMLEGLTDIDGGHATIDGIDVQSHPFKVKKIIGVQLQATNISITCLWLNSSLCLAHCISAKLIQVHCWKKYSCWIRPRPDQRIFLGVRNKGSR